MKTNTVSGRISFRLPQEEEKQFNQLLDLNCSTKSKVMRSLVAAWMAEELEKINA